MLSVLIPVYNFPVFSFVRDLHKSCENSGNDFEIIVFEDGSTFFLVENAQIQGLSNVIYKANRPNVGRSAIRNSLALEATYPNLLFLDGDSGIVSGHFISNYLPYLGSDTVILGGRKYRPGDNKPDNSLLYKYGSKREQNEPRNISVRSKIPVFTSPNFLIGKAQFLKVRFDESFSGYGHEDSIFGIQLRRNSIPYSYIDNPVFHIDLENNSVFLEKSEKALNSLLKLYLSGYFPELKQYSRILQIFERLNKLHLMHLFVFTVNLIRKPIKNNLLSKNPSLLLFDLYKLLHLCETYLKL